MPSLVPGMKQTTSQEEDNYQDAIAESLELDKKERAQNDLESAQVANAIKETSAQNAVMADQDQKDFFMREFCVRIGLKIRPCDADGNCFFRAIAFDLNMSKKDDDGPTSREVAKANPDHAMLRERTIDWMKNNLSIWKDSDPTPELRIRRMSQDKIFADHIELVAMASLLRRQIHVFSWKWYNENQSKPYNTVDPLPIERRFGALLSILNNRPILLFHSKEKHYDLLRDMSDPKPKRPYSVSQAENHVCLVRLSDKGKRPCGIQHYDEKLTYPTSCCFSHWPALMFHNREAYLDSLPVEEREERAKTIAARDDIPDGPPKLYGTFFSEDGLDIRAPYKLRSNGVPLHEILNAETDHLVPFTHIDEFVTSANTMIMNKSVLGKDIFEYAERFLSSVARAKEFAQRDSELQADAFKRPSGTHEGESIPPTGPEAENVNNEDKEENDAGNSDPVDEPNKGDNADSPSGDKGKSHDSSEEGKKDEDKEENDAANSDPVDEPNKGDNADSPSGDKGKSHDSSEEGKKGDGNGLDMKCAAGDLCKMQGAPILEPQHKCMNCRNQMHGGICGVQWSDRRVDQIDISIGKYPPVPFFFTRLVSLSLIFWYSFA